MTHVDKGDYTGFLHLGIVCRGCRRVAATPAARRCRHTDDTCHRGRGPSESHAAAKEDRVPEA